MNTGEILIYQNQEDNIKIDVRLEEETVWLSQAQIATLFGKGRTTITEPFKMFLRKTNWKKKWSVGISDTPLNMAQLKGRLKKKT